MTTTIVPQRKRPATRRPANTSSNTQPVKIIRTDEEAIATAHQLAAIFRAGASDRDRHRKLPYDEIEMISQSGLYGVIAPKKYGGAGVSAVTVAEIFRIIAAADGSLGQIPQNHFSFSYDISEGTPEQQAFYYGRLLKGERIGNALSEADNVKGMKGIKTRLTKTADGYRINGAKAYCTGALFAHWVPIAVLDEQERLWMAYVKRNSPGLTVHDDWSSMGQRTTASGTVTIDNVFVTDAELIPRYKLFEKPNVRAPWGQLPHAAIDLGIAEEAFGDAVNYIKTRSRPWFAGGYTKHSDEPLIIQRIGEFQYLLDTARLFLQRAAELVEIGRADPTEETTLAASLGVAKARIASDRAALHITHELFELCGTKSTFAEFNFDRHWRNARTHTLHDPIRWKIQFLGNYHLNGVRPPRSGAVV